MDKEFKSVLKFQEYKIENIDFKLNHEYEKRKEPVKINFNLRHNVFIEKKENVNVGAVRLTINVFECAVEKGYPFELNVSIVGIFTSMDLDDDRFRRMLDVNGTAILFPFLRSAVADITKTANLNNLLLPLINVHKFLEREKICKIEAVEDSQDTSE